MRAERKKPVERGKLQELECEAEREGLLTSGKKNLIAKGMGLRHYLLRQIRNDLGMHQSELAKECEKALPVKQENQECVISQKPSKESISRRGK